MLIQPRHLFQLCGGTGEQASGFGFGGDSLVLFDSRECFDLSCWVVETLALSARIDATLHEV
jgi:hypothetical protein